MELQKKLNIKNIHQCLKPLEKDEIVELVDRRCMLAETSMTEERKHTILFAATLLSARRLVSNIESDKPKMNKQYFIDRAIEKVCFVMERIDHKEVLDISYN